MDFSNELDAASFIRTRGLDAANEAAILVGMQTTLAMLFVCHDGDTTSKLEMIKEEGLDLLADLDLLAGRAVIYQEGRGAIIAFEIVGDACREVPTQDLRIPMWMGQSISLFGRPAPHVEIQSILLREHKKKVAIVSETISP